MSFEDRMRCQRTLREAGGRPVEPSQRGRGLWCRPRPAVDRDGADPAQNALPDGPGGRTGLARRAAEIGLAVLAAAGRAQGRVWHRDVKPGNAAGRRRPGRADRLRVGHLRGRWHGHPGRHPRFAQYIRPSGPGTARSAPVGCGRSAPRTPPWRAVRRTPGHPHGHAHRGHGPGPARRAGPAPGADRPAAQDPPAHVRPRSSACWPHHRRRHRRRAGLLGRRPSDRRPGRFGGGGRRPRTWRHASRRRHPGPAAVVHAREAVDAGELATVGAAGSEGPGTVRGGRRHRHRHRNAYLDRGRRSRVAHDHRGLAPSSHVGGRPWPLGVLAVV